MGDKKKLTGKRRIQRVLLSMYTALFSHFGHQGWWPAKSDFEMMVGAILTQSTAWRNVEKAIQNLKKQKVLTVKRLHAVPRHQLANCIRPAGYFNVKAKRLKSFTSFLMGPHKGNIRALLNTEMWLLREQLLSVNGIGPETADSMMLYAARKPIFVVDAYTKRIFERHKLISLNATYEEVQELCMAHLPHDVSLFNDFHAQMVKCGSVYCKKKPLCDECPLSVV